MSSVPAREWRAHVPNSPPQCDASRIGRTVRAVSVLFFLSGATALSYEVIWFKLFSHVWGASTLAMASVVGALLIALGLGAWLFGKRVHRLRLPLMWYAACEIGIGLLALIIPEESALLWRLSTPHYEALRDQQLVYAIVRCTTTLVLIGPPAVLMGGTLPLLVRYCSDRVRLSIATARLYSANTAGAALGCYAVGFHVLPAIGLFWTNIATAAVSIAIGAAALACALASRSSSTVSTGENSEAAPVPAEAPPSVPLPAERRSPGYVCLLAGLTGCSALVSSTPCDR